MGVSELWLGFVTTDPAISDTTKTYNIFLNSNKNSLERIKFISSIVNCNYITAKRLIASAPVSVFSGRAFEVKAIKEKLDDAEIAYSIEPEFPF